MAGEVVATPVQNGVTVSTKKTSGKGSPGHRNTKKKNTKDAKMILEAFFHGEISPLSHSENFSSEFVDRHRASSEQEDSEWDYSSTVDLNDELDFYYEKKGKICRRKGERRKSEELKRVCQTCSNPAELGRKKQAIRGRKVPFGISKKEITCWKNKRENVSYRKENVEKELKKRHIQRKWPDGMPKVEWAVENVEKGQKKKQRKRPKWTPTANSHHTGPLHVYNNSDFVLKPDNGDKFGEDQLLSFLIQLQNRDITPEDFDALLQLDDFVKLKTVSKATIDCLKTDRVVSIDGVCMICMEDYDVGDVRKHLPCGHCFHSSCVRTWLSTVSSKCPIDGQDIQ